MSHFTRAVLVAILGLVFLGISAAKPAETTMTVQTANDLFAAGNAFYRSQNFEEAREAYRELLNAGYNSAPVLYNLGTVNARLGDNTTATAYLMRARKLRPRDADIQANLAFVASSVQPTAAAGESVAAETVWSRITSYLTVGEWLAIAWVGWLLICTGVALFLSVRRTRIQSLARVMAWVGIVTVAIVAAPAISRYYSTVVARKAMVLTAADVLSGPADRFTRISTLTEGQLVRDLGDAPSGYRHVKMDNGLQGYVRADVLMPI